MGTGPKDTEYPRLESRAPGINWVAKNPRFLHTDSEDSDQTGQMPRLMWVFAGSTDINWVAKNPRFLHTDSEDSDQTGQMPRLMWVFAGSKDNFVGFIMLWLN